MGRHSSFQKRNATKPDKPVIHPIWRGIGLILILITPVMSYAAMEMIHAANLANKWVPIPLELFSPVIEKYLYVKIVIWLCCMLLIYAFFFLISFALYRFIAPPRYGPYDVPPVAYRGKSYKR